MSPCNRSRMNSEYVLSTDNFFLLFDVAAMDSKGDVKSRVCTLIGVCILCTATEAVAYRISVKTYLYILNVGFIPLFVWFTELLALHTFDGWRNKSTAKEGINPQCTPNVMLFCSVTFEQINPMLPNSRHLCIMVCLVPCWMRMTSNFQVIWHFTAKYTSYVMLVCTVTSEKSILCCQIHTYCVLWCANPYSIQCQYEWLWPWP